MPTLNNLQGILEPKDSGDAMPLDGGGKNPGGALSKFDFSHVNPSSDTDPGSQGPDHLDMHARSLRCRPMMRSTMPSARWVPRITSTQAILTRAIWTSR